MKRIFLIALLSCASLLSAQNTRAHSLGGGRTIGIAGNAMPPTVAITSPTGGTVSGTITVAVSATSPVGIFSVELLIDGTIFGTDNVPPYNFSWNTTLYSNATHSLQAEAIDINGLTAFSSTVTVTVSNVIATTPFFAALPTQWVSNFISTPTVTITLGTSPNKGPNCHTETYGSCSGAVLYTDDQLGLLDAKDNWRDNADQLTGGSQAAHFADIGWLVNVPCQSCVGSPGILNSAASVYDVNSALLTLPAKCSGNATDPGGPCGINGSGEATQWLIINSTTPNTLNVEVCGRGLPGIGSGIRNPGCANDKPKMWHLQLPNGASSPAGGGAHEVVYASSDCYPSPTGALGCPRCNAFSGSNCTSFATECGKVAGNGTPASKQNPLACYVNHTAVMNLEADQIPGATQSGFSGTKAPNLVQYASQAWSNGTPTTKNPSSKHNVFEYSYVHGNDPGDATQPNSLGSPYEDSAGTCTAFAVGRPIGIVAWGNPQNVTISGSTLTHSPILNGAGKDISQFYGPSLYAGETITLGGGASTYPEVQFTVSSFDPTSSNTSMVLTSAPTIGQLLTVAGNGTGTGYNIGDHIAIVQSGGTAGTAAVSNTTGPGTPTGYTISLRGSGFTSASGVTTNMLTGTGSGATVTITAIGSTTPIEFSATDASNNITSVPGYVTNSCTPSSGNCQSQANYGGTANPVVYTPGCGDDTVAGINANGDFLYIGYDYDEKIHWANNESKGMTFGFATGPLKIAHSFFEGGSESSFSGGSPTDTNGGPSSNNQLYINNYGKDLNWRFLSAGAGNSPAPPWGCGTIDGDASHDTCPFPWAIKNDFELKVGHFNLVAGNIIDGCWADGQTGRCLVIDERISSGGTMSGIYAPNGLPASGTDNVRVESNWIRNGPQPGGMSPRALGPGNGGGVSFPGIAVDYINNIFSNYGDNGQFGSPGGPAGGIINFAPGGNTYQCGASPFSGGGTSSAIVQAYCQPFQGDISSKIGSITRSGTCPGATCLVTVQGSVSRFDPYLCPFGTTSTALATCVQDGFTFTIIPTSGAPAGLNRGDFAMNSGIGNWASDGTGANGFTYFDPGAGAAGTVCGKSPAPTCSSVINVALLASLAYKITDITGGNPIQASSNVYMDNETYPVLSAVGTGTSATYSLGVAGTNAACVGVIPANPNCSGMAVGDPISITGMAPSCFNHTGTIASVVDAFTFTVGGLVSCSGSSTSGGSILDTSCSAGNFTAGVAAPAVQACGSNNASCASPATSPIDTQLKVYYKSANATGSGNACVLSNQAGLPQYVTFQSNTILSPNIVNIFNDSTASQAFYNLIFNNVFMTNDVNNPPSTSGTSDLYCTKFNNKEGSASGRAASCWDPSTFQFYSNVLTTRNSSSSIWPVASQSGGLFPTPGGVVNYFPTSFNCPSGVGSSCLGFTGFIGSTPTITYPSGSCPNANAPFNCPLMSAPWKTSNPLTLADLAYDSASSYKTRGANVTAINSLMTGSQYVCPTGAICGTKTSITQVAATTTVATYTATNSFYPGEYLASVGTCSHSQFNLSGVYVATASPTQFTINGSFSGQATAADVCLAVTGPAPD